MQRMTTRQVKRRLREYALKSMEFLIDKEMLKSLLAYRAELYDKDKKPKIKDNQVR